MNRTCNRDFGGRCRVRRIAVIELGSREGPTVATALPLPHISTFQP